MKPFLLTIVLSWGEYIADATKLHCGRNTAAEVYEVQPQCPQEHEKLAVLNERCGWQSGTLWIESAVTFTSSLLDPHWLDLGPFGHLELKASFNIGGGCWIYWCGVGHWASASWHSWPHQEKHCLDCLTESRYKRGLPEKALDKAFLPKAEADHCGCAATLPGATPGKGSQILWEIHDAWQFLYHRASLGASCSQYASWQTW